VLVFSKRHALPDGHSDVVIVVVNLDPHATRETMVHLDLEALGLTNADSFVVHDEITGADWSWGEHNYVRLDPFDEPAHILTVRKPR
jgi:starch synthase (maltosyl-transferring)